MFIARLVSIDGKSDGMLSLSLPITMPPIARSARQGTCPLLWLERPVMRAEGDRTDKVNNEFGLKRASAE
jgi:hypothetical protein